MTDIKLKSDDCHFGDILSKFRVRASAELAFYLEVEAHDAKEAQLLAENYCEKISPERWFELSEHVHKTLEGDEVPPENPANEEQAALDATANDAQGLQPVAPDNNDEPKFIPEGAQDA